MKMATVFCLFACALLAAGCRKNSAQIAEQVKVEMQREFTKKPGLKDLAIERVRLVKQSDEDFSGVAVGNINGEYVKFNVSCKYDGTSILWDANLPEEELDALKLKESARETYLLLKRTWPKVRASIGETCDAAKRSVAEGLEAAKEKAGEYYGLAKEKAGEYYGRAKEKAGEYYGRAKEKAGEYYDRAKERAAELTEETSSKPKGEVAPATSAESAKE